MSPQAILCPRCRKIIGSNETSCSWCGYSRPSGWRQTISWATRGGLDGDWLVKAIITVNVALFLLSLVMSSRSGSGGGNPLGILSPDQTSLLLLGATGTVPIERYGRLWTLLSANYLHGGIFHILFNMMAIRQIAPWVIQEYGVSRMFAIYSLGGVCGYLVSWWAGVPFTIGASAAVCALIGALLYYGKSRGGVYGGAVFREVSGWVAGLVIFGLMVPGINNWAHGGGIVGGALLGMLFGYGERQRELLWHRGLASVSLLCTVIVLVWGVFGAVTIWFSR